VVTSWLLGLVGPARVEGLEHVPRTGPMLVVANHCSNLDPPTVGWAVGHRTGRIIHFMAKEEMRSWPVAGLLARDAGVIFVRRGSGDRPAQRTALAVLEQGGALGIFPEGTRSRNGILAEGRAGAALMAMRTGVPIVPVGVAGTQHIFRGRRLIPRRSKVTIRIGPVFHLPVNANGLDRAALRAGTETIMRAIAALLPPEQRGRWDDPIGPPADAIAEGAAMAPRLPALPGPPDR
jgi:1-acyl-sn-glycerol-3-phosphate acyltransferase